jgi:hypothetical protein
MRPWKKRVAIAALALAGVWPAPAQAQISVPVAPQPQPQPQPQPPERTAPPLVLQAPSRLGPSELHQLAEVLTNAAGPVILRVPGSASITAPDDTLNDLALAAEGSTLFVVQQGNARLDGAASILSAFAAASFRTPGSEPASGPPGRLWPKVERLTHCTEPCPPALTTGDAPAWMGIDPGAPAVEANLASANRALSDVLDERAPGGGGGGSRLLVPGLILLIAGGLGYTAIALRRRQRRPSQAMPVTVPEATHPDEPPPPAPPGPPAPQPPARTGRSRPARVVSVLHPEGYVELDGCLHRVRWASSGAAAVAPGDRVEIEKHGRRLWAFAAARSIASAARAGATSERQRRESF